MNDLRVETTPIPGLLVVEIKAETEALFDQGIAAALRWGAVGGVLVLLLLGAGRGVAGGLRIALALCGALLLTFAALHALGERITVFHLTAALLLAGVGMAILPETVVLGELRSGLLHAIPLVEPAFNKSEIHIVYRRGRKLPKTATALLDLIEYEIMQSAKAEG